MKKNPICALIIIHKQHSRLEIQKLLQDIYIASLNQKHQILTFFKLPS